VWISNTKLLWQGGDVVTKWKKGEIIFGEYGIIRLLGQGGMGRVWLVENKNSGAKFAVKQATLNKEKQRAAFLRELQVWIDLPEHPNIVPCRFFRTQGGEIVIFAGYVENGSLADYIKKNHPIALETILDMAIQFA
jgi:serine/threonine protein kinase